jgi:hypothetical protein
MGDYSQKEDKTDISRNVEEILSGIFLLFVRVATTFYYFMLKPRFFSQVVASSEPLSTYFPKKYSRPITYYFISLAVMTGGFILLFRITPYAADTFDNNTFIVIIINAFKEGEIIKLIIGLLPFILTVGLYSFCLFWINKKRYPQLEFMNSLWLSSYFAGSVLLIYIILIPIYPLF